MRSQGRVRPDGRSSSASRRVRRREGRDADGQRRRRSGARLLARRAEVGLDHARVPGELGGRALRARSRPSRARSRSRRPRARRARSARPAGSSRRSRAARRWSRRCRARRAAPGRGSARRASAARGLPISARPTASICRSPPESVPASWARRSFRRGNSMKTSSSDLRAVLAAEADLPVARRAAGCPRPTSCRTARASRAPAPCRA